MVMIILFLVGFTIGLPHFYAGNTKKGVLYLLLFWPCNVIGWILLVMFIGIVPLLIAFAMIVWGVIDFVKLCQGMYLDGNKLPIVNQ